MQDNVIHGVMDTGAPAVDRAAQSPPGDTSWLITRGHLQLDHLLTSSFDFSLFLPSLILSLPHFFPSLSLPRVPSLIPSFPPPFLTFTFTLPPSFVYSFPPSSILYFNFSLPHSFVYSFLSSFILYFNFSLSLFPSFIPSFPPPFFPSLPLSILPSSPPLSLSSTSFPLYTILLQRSFSLLSFHHSFA